jgi:hypothetical protein
MHEGCHRHGHHIVTTLSSLEPFSRPLMPTVKRRKGNGSQRFVEHRALPTGEVHWSPVIGVKMSFAVYRQSVVSPGRPASPSMSHLDRATSSRSTAIIRVDGGSFRLMRRCPPSPEFGPSRASMAATPPTSKNYFWDEITRSKEAGVSCGAALVARQRDTSASLSRPEHEDARARERSLS